MKQRKLYTPEFKVQALELLATGKPVPELAGDLGISTSLLYNWRAGAQGRPPPAGAPKRTTCGICAGKMPASRWKMTF